LHPHSDSLQSVSGRCTHPPALLNCFPHSVRWIRPTSCRCQTFVLIHRPPLPTHPNAL
jgi:hypothetical protein